MELNGEVKELIVGIHYLRSLIIQKKKYEVKDDKQEEDVEVEVEEKEEIKELLSNITHFEYLFESFDELLFIQKIKMELFQLISCNVRKKLLFFFSLSNSLFRVLKQVNSSYLRISQ